MSETTSTEEPICPDYGGEKWFWNGTYYIRRNRVGDITSKIRPKSLPDPTILFTKRKALFPIARNEQINPSAATLALWKHKESLAHVISNDKLQPNKTSR